MDIAVDLVSAAPAVADLRLNHGKIYAEMGYRRRSQVDGQIVELTESLLAEISEFVAPEWVFCRQGGMVTGQAVRLDEGAVLQVGGILAPLLDGSCEIAVFAATAGAAFQEYQEALAARDDLLTSFLAGAIGSCVVEATGDHLESLLTEQLHGLRHTNRFSPGYCDWRLTDQRELFRLLGGNPCGITLSDFCLMTPIKSISGVIGIGADVRERMYGCHYCTLESCYKRRTPNRRRTR